MLSSGTAAVLMSLALQGSGAEVRLARPAPERAPARESRVTLDLVNDGFATIYDEGYSSGVRLFYRSGAPFEAWSFGAGLAGLFGARAVDEYWTWGLAHDMWTPADLTTDDPVLLADDRPYAGLLSGEVHTDVVLDRAIAEHGYSRLSAMLMVGVTGDWSFSEPLQTRWHAVLRNFTGKDYPRDPQGWDVYEVPNTVLVGLRLGGETEVARSGGRGAWSGLSQTTFGTRATIRGDCDLGTFRIGCETGLTVRGGWMPELVLDGASPIIEGHEGAALPVNGHFFLSTRIGLAAFDALLDGPIGTDGPRSTGDKRLVRGTLEIGGLLQLWSWELVYSYLFQTHELTPLPAFAVSVQRMGRVRISYRF